MSHLRWLLAALIAAASSILLVTSYTASSPRPHHRPRLVSRQKSSSADDDGDSSGGLVPPRALESEAVDFVLSQVSELLGPAAGPSFNPDLTEADLQAGLHSDVCIRI